MSAFHTQPAFIRLRDIIAENTSSVLAWVGSGLSASASLPTWETLRQKLVAAALAKSHSFSDSPEKVNYSTELMQIKESENLWVAFERLQKLMGPTTFREEIRSILATSDRLPIPRPYERLWEMKLGGVLTLNLDKFIGRAFAKQRQGAVPLTEFAGRDVADYLHILKSPNQFIAYLHGTAEQHSSWVFTKTDLRSLQSTPGFTDFITACFSSRTIVFIGISADDIAAGGYLETLTKRHIDVGSHFWITDRTNTKIDTWAEQTGIQVIRYTSKEEDHSQLEALFQEILSHIPKDTEPVPIVPSTFKDASDNTTYTEEELMRMTTENKRRILALMTSRVLCSDSPNKYNEYEALVKRFDEQIHQAWYITDNEGSNKLFQYSLNSEIAAGAFGSVYTATNERNETVAIKILHQQVRRKPGWLQSFRRGVAAMRILTKSAIPGVVRFIDAGEIPAFAVMEYVEGPNLETSVKNHFLSKWDKILLVCQTLSSTIHSAHRLPEHVLHRDIRPANVVIRNGWQSPELWEVVVLDFDLAWHKEAIETSVSAPGTGYLAPEQANRDPRHSTRNALVDSYGLGMTMFFMRTGREPTFNEAAHADWFNTLMDQASKYPCSEWKSLPTRYFRLIEECTRPNQSERWDMTQIISEVDRLMLCLKNPGLIRSAEIVAEELAARAFSNKYRWLRESLCADISIGGIQVTICGSESAREITIVVTWTHTGSSSFKSVSQWLPDAADKIASRFRRIDWKVTSDLGQYLWTMTAKLGAVAVGHNLDSSVLALQSALNILSRW